MPKISKEYHFAPSKVTFGYILLMMNISCLADQSTERLGGGLYYNSSPRHARVLGMHFPVFKFSHLSVKKESAFIN